MILTTPCHAPLPPLEDVLLNQAGEQMLDQAGQPLYQG